MWENETLIELSELNFWACVFSQSKTTLRILKWSYFFYIDKTSPIIAQFTIREEEERGEQRGEGEREGRREINYGNCSKIWKLNVIASIKLDQHRQAINSHF